MAGGGPGAEGRCRAYGVGNGAGLLLGRHVVREGGEAGPHMAGIVLSWFGRGVEGRVPPSPLSVH